MRVPSAGAAPAAAPPHPGLVRAAPRATPAHRRGLQPGNAQGRRSGLDRHRYWGGTGAWATAALELPVN